MLRAKEALFPQGHNTFDACFCSLCLDPCPNIVSLCISFAPSDTGWNSWIDQNNNQHKLAKQMTNLGKYLKANPEMLASIDRLELMPATVPLTMSVLQGR